MNTVVGMILEVGKGKRLEEAKEKKHQENRVRLNRRMKQIGLYEKREIPGFFKKKIILILKVMVIASSTALATNYSTP